LRDTDGDALLTAAHTWIENKLHQLVSAQKTPA
jgi:hypothetical protein